MKLLSVLFLVGLALSYAVPLKENKELSLNEVQELDLFLEEVLQEERSTRDIKESLKNLFDRLMEKVAEVTEKGKDVNGGLVDRVRNLVDKMKNKGFNLDNIKEKIRERGGGLSEKLKETWTNFWEKLGLGSKEYAEAERSTRDLKESLKNLFDRIQEKVAEVIEKGKDVNSNLMDRVKNLVDKMKDKGLDLDNIKEKIRERGGGLSDKVKEAWTNFWEKLGLGSKEYSETERSTRDLKESLKNLFDRIQEKVAEVIEKGKDVNSNLMDRVKNLVDKMKDKGLDLDNIKEKIRERGGGLSEKVKEAWTNFWEKLGLGSKEYSEAERSTRDLKESLKNLFDRIQEKVAEVIEKGKDVNSNLMDRVKNLVDKMKDKGINLDSIKDKIKERGGGLSEKLKETWTNFWEKLGLGSKEDAEGERSTRDAKETLNKMFDRLLEMITQSVERGKEIREELAARIKNLLERAKKIGMDLREKLLEKSENLSEEARKLYKEFLNKIGIEEEDVEFADFAEFAEDDDDIKTELGKSLREHLNGILQLIRESIERGDAVKEETLKKLKDIRNKMRELRVELGQRAKELLQKIREKGRDYWQKIKDIFGGKNRQESDVDEETRRRFDKILNKLVERLRRFLESGKKIRQNIVDRVKDVLQKMKDMGISESEIDGKFRSLLERLSEEGKKAMKTLLERLGIKRDERMIEFAEDGDEDIKERMGGIFQRFLDRLKNVLENRKGISQRLVNRIKELLRKLKNIGIGDTDISNKFTDLFGKLSEKGKRALEKLLIKLGLKKEERMIELADDGEDDEDNSLKERLGKILREFLDKLKNVLEKNRNISQRIVDRMKDMIKKMKNLGTGESDIKEKFLDLRKKLTDIGKGALDNLMERIGLTGKDSTIEFADDGDDTEESKDLREKFEDLIKKIRDALENGRSFRDGLEKLKEIRERLKELRGKLGDKAKDLVEKLRDKIKEYFEKLMEKFNRKEERSLKDIYENIKEYLKNLQIDLKERFVKFGEWAKEKFEEGLEKGKDRTETLKKLAKEFIFDVKSLGKDTVLQAKYFFREYKEDLGELYIVVKEKIKEKLESMEAYERVREYLSNLHIELKEKFTKFGEWAKEKFERGLDQGKDRAKNVKSLARQFIDDAKVIGRDVAVQAKEFFREYKEDLGTIYDRVREKVREVLEREDLN